MNKHTPGPWIAEQRDTRSVVLAAKGRCLLADCPQWSNRDDRPRAAEAFANAKLFAAAPDLLDALESVSQEHDLLRWMKNIEMRRSQGSFGIAVADDSDAIGWQEQAEKLKVLVDRRESAIARARGDA